MRLLAKLVLIFSLCLMPSFAADTSKNKKTASKNKIRTVKKTSPQVEKLAIDEETLANIFKNDVRQDANFTLALDRSIEYFDSIKTENKLFKYGTEAYTPEEMLQSMLLFKDLTIQDISYEDFLSEIYRQFDIYSINNSMKRSIFTGYFTPRLNASLTQCNEYNTPLHLQDGSKIYVKSLTEAKSAVMEGAGILNLDSGDTKVITYAKTQYLPKQVKTKRVVKQASKKKKTIFVTKTIYTPRTLFSETSEPLGSVATPLTPGFSAAMDPKYTPMGSLIYVYNQQENGEQPFERFMLVQDVGGAIKGPGRIDIYLGEGKKAEKDTFALSRTGSILMIVAKKEALSNAHLASLKIEE